MCVSQSISAAACLALSENAETISSVRVVESYTQPSGDDEQVLGCAGACQVPSSFGANEVFTVTLPRPGATVTCMTCIYAELAYHGNKNSQHCVFTPAFWTH
jgi:hypothetical protein